MFRVNKLPLTLALGVLVLVAFGTSCKGFFVNPTLTSIDVGPDGVSVPIGKTQQMTATGTYDNGGAPKNITSASGIVWTSSDSTIATVSNSGLVTGVATGSPTITAQMGTVSGQSSIDVTLTNITGITVTPTSSNVKANGGTTTFQALATVSGSSTKVDVTAQASWSITNSSNFTLTQGETPVTVTTTASAPVNEQDTLTASYTSGTTTFTATAKVTVTQ